MLMGEIKRMFFWKGEKVEVYCLTCNCLKPVRAGRVSAHQPCQGFSASPEDRKEKEDLGTQCTAFHQSWGWVGSWPWRKADFRGK